MSGWLLKIMGAHGRGMAAGEDCRTRTSLPRTSHLGGTRLGQALSQRWSRRKSVLFRVAQGHTAVRCWGTRTGFRPSLHVAAHRVHVSSAERQGLGWGCRKQG